MWKRSYLTHTGRLAGILVNAALTAAVAPLTLRESCVSERTPVALLTCVALLTDARAHSQTCHRQENTALHLYLVLKTCDQITKNNRWTPGC